MSELEDKLSGILGNPAMMQQIMGMARMLSQQEQVPPPSPQAQNPASCPSNGPGIDPKMLQAITGVLSHSGTDSHQQGLLKALQPYLSRDRLQRLERAMHAARMAGAASALLNCQNGR